MLLVETSRRYPAAPTEALQLAEKLVVVIELANAITGASGAVINDIVPELVLVPLLL